MPAEGVGTKGDIGPEMVKEAELTVRCGGEGDRGVKGDLGISPATSLTQQLPESI